MQLAFLQIPLGQKPFLFVGACVKIQPGLFGKCCGHFSHRKGEEKLRKDKPEKEGILDNYWYLYKGWIQQSRWNLFFAVMAVAGSVAGTYVGL